MTEKRSPDAGTPAAPVGDVPGTPVGLAEFLERALGGVQADALLGKLAKAGPDGLRGDDNGNAADLAGRMDPRDRRG